MKSGRAALAFGLIGVAALYVALGASQRWDFETYYYAASACRAQLNPYDLSALSSVAGKRVDLPFVYPPVALVPFLALSLLPLSTASLVWLGLKLVFLARLLVTWRRIFLREIPMEAMLGVTLFGFNAAALWDLRTGNVAIVEALLLWAGFSSYIRARTVRSACFIAAASVFKIAPIAFLGLLLLGPSTRKKNVLAVVIGVALLALLLVASWPLTVEWARALARSLATEWPTGEVNPSALGILDGILGDTHRALALPLFALYACIIALAAVPMIRRLRKTGSRGDWVIVAITLWTLLSPRMMIYSYILMVVPALFVIRSAITSPWTRGFAYMLLMIQGLVRLLPGRPPTVLAEGPFLLTVLVFALLVARVTSVGFLQGPRVQIPGGDT
jgi:hypothetical protein